MASFINRARDAAQEAGFLANLMRPNPIRNPTHRPHGSTFSLTPNRSQPLWGARAGGGVPTAQARADSRTCFMVYITRSTFHSAQSNFQSILSYRLSPSRKPQGSQERGRWSPPGPGSPAGQRTCLWSVGCLARLAGEALKHPTWYYLDHCYGYPRLRRVAEGSG